MRLFFNSLIFHCIGTLKILKLYIGILPRKIKNFNVKRTTKVIVYLQIIKRFVVKLIVEIYFTNTQ